MTSSIVRTLLAGACLVVACASQRAAAGASPQLIVRGKGYQISFQQGPQSDPIALKGKTTLRVGTSKTDLPQDTYTFVPDNQTSGLSKLQLWYNGGYAGVITISGSGPAKLTGHIDGVGVKQSTDTSDIKLGQ